MLIRINKEKVLPGYMHYLLLSMGIENKIVNEEEGLLKLTGNIDLTDKQVKEINELIEEEEE